MSSTAAALPHHGLEERRGDVRSGSLTSGLADRALLTEYVDLSPANLAAALRDRDSRPGSPTMSACSPEEAASDRLAATTTTVQDLTGRPPRTFKEFPTANMDALQARR